MPTQTKERPSANANAKTAEYRRWRGVNTTDARTDIEDDEVSYAENAMTIGRGAIQLTPTAGASIATIAAGVTSFMGFVLTLAGTATPLFVTVNPDGSATQVKTDGTQTVVCAAGILTSAARMAIFRDTTILFVDPVKGYASWDGATFTIIDATKTGVAIAVFESRVWLASARTITFTAPNTFNNFSGAAGAGSTIITDEAFPGVITDLHSVVENLWVAGEGAFEAIANVVTTGGTTTFSVTNILTGLGTNAPASVIGYFRSLCFLTASGVWALAGVTPQKLSDKLDGLWPALTFDPDAPSAIATVQNLLVLCFLVTYTQATVPSLPTPASGVTTATPLLICFTQGKWFFATQGALTWITTLIENGTSEAWGTDGSTIFKLFGGGTAPVPYKVQGKLYSFGSSTSAWEAKRIGLEYQAADAIAPVLTIDNGATSETEAVSSGNALTLINNTGGVLTLVNNVLGVLTLIVQGLVLSRAAASMYGNYLGWTVSGTDIPYRIAAVQLEYAPSGQWTLVSPTS